MNNFYHFEGNIYETVEAVEAATRNYCNKRYDVIKTLKSFDEFEEEYDKCRKEGNSILDSIEWAK